MNPVGYLINYKEGLAGKPGMFYDYIYAGNGVFIQAQNNFIIARICIADVPIRGLAPADRKIELVHGKIPERLYNLALSILIADRHNERYVSVSWKEEEYHLTFPWQEGSPGHVTYEIMDNNLLDIHSHNVMKGRHSPIDNRDEQGFIFSAVVGKLDRLIPETEIRISVYGYYDHVRFGEVFDVRT